MQITFWSHVHGQPRSTSNMMAIAVTATLESNITCLLAQTHFNLNNLEESLIGYKRDKESLIDVGSDELARSPKLSNLDKDTIYDCTISALHKRLYLLPGTAKDNREDYEKSTGKKLKRIFAAAEKYYDTVFVDTNAGKSELTMEIIDGSDLVVVNLCQNIAMIDRYFKEFSLDHKNVIYIIGNYDKDSHYSLYNLKKRYEQLRNGKVAVIPICTEFMDAQSGGKVLKFIQKNIDCKKGKNAYFIKCVKEAVVMIMKAAKEGR